MTLGHQQNGGGATSAAFQPAGLGADAAGSSPDKVLENKSGFTRQNEIIVAPCEPALTSEIPIIGFDSEWVQDPTDPHRNVILSYQTSLRFGERKFHALFLTLAGVKAWLPEFLHPYVVVDWRPGER